MSGRVMQLVESQRIMQVSPDRKGRGTLAYSSDLQGVVKHGGLELVDELEDAVADLFDGAYAVDFVV